MGTKPGMVQIEETGLPVVDVPVSVSVWAASNPDEEPGPLAEIRRQLSDRFDLAVQMGRPSTTEAVVDILMTNEAIKSGQANVFSEPSPQEIKRIQAFQQDIISISEQHDLPMPEYLTNFLASIYINFNIESLRALEAITQAAMLHAALRKRNQMMISDIMTVLPMVLCHRVSPTTLMEIMNTVNSRMSSGEKATYAAAAPTTNKGTSNRFTNFFSRGPEPKGSDKTQGIDQEGEESPPEKARYLHDMLDSGVIKRENDLS
jgi:magnesium chelatase subunit I